MSTVIRDGIIRISIQQGTVELKAPDIAPIIAQRKEEVSVQQDLMAAIQEGAAIEEKAATARVAEINKAKEAAARALAEQEEGVIRLAKSQAEMLEGVNRIGSGFLSLGRSAALFTSSTDEDLRQVVQTLATFQAGFDLLRGGIDLFAGTVKVLEQMQNARKLAAAATTVETTAIAANTSTATANTAAQTGMLAALSATNPVLLALVATLAAAAVAWKLYADSVEAAKDAERKAADEFFARHSEYDAAIRANTDSLKDFISEEERRVELAKRLERGGEAQDTFKQLQDARPFQQDEQGYLSRTQATLQAAIAANRELLDLEKQKSQERTQALDVQAREIEQQQRIAEAAQKSLEVEQKKVQAFEAQFGALDKGEQKRLKSITDQVRGGGTENLKRSDLEFLGQSGGDQGRAIAQEEFARRGRDQGAGNIFNGIANPALDQASSIFQREQGKLNDLTGGQSAEDALAGIEDEKKALLDTVTDLRKSIRNIVEPMVETMNSLANEVKKIKSAVQGG